MELKFGPDSDFAKQMELKFGPDSDFAKQIKDKLKESGPGGDEAEAKKAKQRIEVKSRVDAEKLRADAEKARAESSEGQGRGPEGRSRRWRPRSRADARVKEKAPTISGTAGSKRWNPGSTRCCRS